MSKEWFIKDGGQVCFKSDNAELNGWDIQSLVDCLNGKEQKISDLEAKLAERDKTIDEINKEFLSVIKDWKQLVEIEKAEKAHLKQQLAEYGDINNALNSGLKDKCISCEEEHNQDKISFAIAELEKVKDYAQHIQGGLINYIENQINGLKGEK